MRNSIRFLLGHEVVELSDCAPTATVLDYLRIRKGLTGSKEGCAEGDCGACTVVVAEAEGQALSYKALNACILFLPALDGKQLITVEHLADARGGLHPVQQALVDAHGSQCGFCTPGFVMSLFARYHADQEEPPSRKEIDETLAGNLCRCTGYVPIVNAARQVLTEPARDRFRDMQPATLDKLNALQSDEFLGLENAHGRFFAPRSLAQMLDLMDSYPEATLLGGATDVGLWVNKQLKSLPSIIYTGRVRELRQILRDELNGQLEIGAAVTYTEALPWLERDFPQMSEMLGRLGAAQVRNAGTIGGNIANGSPIGDMPPALIALGSTLVLASHGSERALRLEDFFIEYGKQDLRIGECVARVSIPLPHQHQLFATYKVSKRFEQDISALCGAFALQVDNGIVKSARVCFGGMAGTPARAYNCERRLAGQPWSMPTVRAAMLALDSDYQPISDMRASAEYRRQAARNLLLRFYLENSDSRCPVRLSERPLAAQGIAT